MILDLPPMPTDAEPVKVPGLLNWLGREPGPVDPDFKASIDSGLTESFEDYCTRISQKAVS